MAAATDKPFKIGIDIGGTFTDIVLMDGQGGIFTRKEASTPEDYSLGILRGVQALLSENNVDPADVGDVVHATTVATNAVLEGKGARTGLITTEGFRDVLEFRRVRVPQLYDLSYQKPAPLVPRRLRLEVRERLAADGTVRIPLDEASAIRAAERLHAANVEAVAVCLLHSYVNAEHERRVAEIVKDVLPADAFVTCSYEILPEMREYERTSTTVVNAYLGPVLRRYLATLQERLRALGIKRPLRVMQSSGSQMGLAMAAVKPAYLVESGPAAGVIAAVRMAKQSGIRDLITLDIGGTTAKAAIVENGQPARTNEYEVGAGINLSSSLVKGAGHAVKLPFIDVSEIGAGGGSYVWFDKGGLLKVGPQSAGSVPGPVCYGAGGKQITLTDALLALGYVNPHQLAGGAVELSPGLALDALDQQICKTLRTSQAEAAFGILKVSVANMVRAVKSVSTNRGRDPRDYALLAFGGNGPVVACAVARELGIRRVLVPPFPGVLSSYGLLVADSSYELVKAFGGLLRDVQTSAVDAASKRLADEAARLLADEGFSPQEIKTSLLFDLRYAGQAYELTLPSSSEGPPNLRKLEDAFHKEHGKTYGHNAVGEKVELVNIRVIAKVAAKAVDARHGSSAQKPSSSVERDAYFGSIDRSQRTRVLKDRALLGSGTRGPLLIDEYDATIVVPPNATAALDGNGNVVITLDAAQ